MNSQTLRWMTVPAPRSQQGLKVARPSTGIARMHPDRRRIGRIEACVSD